MTDHRRAWIDLAENIRTFGGPEEDLRKLLVGILNLPIDKELVHAILDTTADALVQVVYSPDNVREHWGRRIALVLEGQPEFDVPRFMRHATSDSPDDSNAYNRENPEEAMKIDIEAG